MPAQEPKLRCFHQHSPEFEVSDVTDCCRDGKGKGKASSDGLQLPDVDTVLPLQTAMQGLSSQPAAAVKAVYVHWCQKRQYSERPLLQRLWYEPPWHRLTVAGMSVEVFLRFLND